MPPDVLVPGDPRTRDALDAWLSLQLSCSLEPEAAVERLRAGAGPAETRRTLAGPRGPAAAVLARARGRLERAGAVLVPYGSRAYPEPLAALPDAPPVLSVIGDVASLSATAVAIVGARAATVHGRRTARVFGADLARAGVVVVSGLAYGIDAEAHRGALEAGGLTIGVLACGPDQVYPRAHAELSRAVARQGAIVSEMPPGTPPRAAFFPLRNRLITGLARALLVVEARERSGSLVSVRHALNQGRDVLVVPGPIHAPTSAGSNRLLRDGARVALEAAHVLVEIGLDPALPRLAHPPPPPTSRGAAVLALLEQAPGSTDALARALGVAPEAIALDLLELQLAGRVDTDRDGRWCVVA